MPVAPSEVLRTIADYTRSLRVFETVGVHEPRTAPTSLPHIAWFLGAPQGAPGGFKVIPRVSGLASAGMRLDVIGRIYMDAKTPPKGSSMDEVDGILLDLIEAVMVKCSANISLGLQQNGVWTDANGADSDGLSCDIGYLDQDQPARKFRIAEIYVPVIITDFLPQEV